MVGTGVALAALFATSALASVEPAMGGMMAPRAALLEPELDDGSDDALKKRQTPAVTNGTQINLDQWDTDTLAACMSSLSQLQAATNPSGTAVCYNLFNLQTDTGAFMADLRLFQVSTPSGDFQGIPPQEISVGLQYTGASVSPVSQGTNARSGATKRQTTSSPTLLQTYMFVGQIDEAQMNQPMTMGVLEALVMPVITLSARNLVGQQVSTTVNHNEASFVNGIFSKEVVMSDLSIATLAVDDLMAGLRNGTVAFVLPGVNILIFPVGLILTSIWFVIGVGFYGFGTYERYSYRDTYRSRKARANGKPVNARI
ncbi:hypothetical protein GGS23DRAFT_390667 [Durotheca rogersii]|uniref:uncharacterized protein n=1 Tax=Durotheca rogersii TaxID=419775 RepID=UPI00221E4E2E|nr:uncharacterized protein GGS23DRAFT_390667 [Durotheca rogersii]KAI5856740.1 hypothetical protein GGS23DRAFT_390667 [Durotheca rogersii]